MHLLALKEALRCAWGWCRRHWRTLLGVLVPVVGLPIMLWLLFRRSSSDAAKLLGDVNQSHRKELDAIADAERLEREAVEAARRRRDAAVEQIEVDYSIAQVELDDAKREEIRELVERHEDDPEALTDELARLTGARVWTGRKN